MKRRVVRKGERGERGEGGGRGTHTKNGFGLPIQLDADMLGVHTLLLLVRVGHAGKGPGQWGEALHAGGRCQQHGGSHQLSQQPLQGDTIPPAQMQSTLLTDLTKNTCSARKPDMQSCLSEGHSSHSAVTHMLLSSPDLSNCNPWDQCQAQPAVSMCAIYIHMCETSCNTNDHMQATSCKCRVQPYCVQELSTAKRSAYCWGTTTP